VNIPASRVRAALVRWAGIAGEQVSPSPDKGRPWTLRPRNPYAPTKDGGIPPLLVEDARVGTEPGPEGRISRPRGAQDAQAGGGPETSAKGSASPSVERPVSAQETPEATR
jgi:hypothetical protein